jgi:hypothetical protein
LFPLVIQASLNFYVKTKMLDCISNNEWLVCCVKVMNEWMTDWNSSLYKYWNIGLVKLPY